MIPEEVINDQIILAMRSTVETFFGVEDHIYAVDIRTISKCIKALYTRIQSRITGDSIKFTAHILSDNESQPVGTLTLNVYTSSGSTGPQVNYNISIKILDSTNTEIETKSRMIACDVI